MLFQATSAEAGVSMLTADLRRMKVRGRKQDRAGPSLALRDRRGGAAAQWWTAPTGRCLLGSSEPEPGFSSEETHPLFVFLFSSRSEIIENVCVNKTKKSIRAAWSSPRVLPRLLAGSGAEEPVKLVWVQAAALHSLTAGGRQESGSAQL